MSRRDFVGLGGVGAAALAFGMVGVPSEGRTQSNPRFRGDPFGLGIASGDPLPDSVVIWTRLAPEPLEPFGGLDYGKKYPVRWEVAEDEGFRDVVREGTAFALSEYGHSVHVDVGGLRPGREYYYRFKVGPEVSPAGRTKTAPAPGSSPERLAFAFASCQAWYDGHYTAYGDMARQDLDLVLHLGDYVYEYSIASDGGFRNRPVPDRFNRETVTLDDYRGRYALYKTDPDLQAAHAAFAWAVTSDDHEVVNNYADEDHFSAPPEDFLVRRANAYRAFWENMPLRPPRQPTGPDMPLYRRLTYGDLAEFSVMDTRQYRDDQANGDGVRRPNGASRDPARTLTGEAQERWLLDGLSGSGARWNVLAQQVFFARQDLDTGDGLLYNMDAWDGYEPQRDRIVDYFRQAAVRNPVVLTGDVHASWASDIKDDFDDPDSETLGVEFVGTSISSAGDGADTSPWAQGILAENPHTKFFNGQRGYVRCTVTPEEWRADYRVTPYVTEPGAPVYTRASFATEAGNPGLRQVDENPVRGQKVAPLAEVQPEFLDNPTPEAPRRRRGR